MDIRVVVLLAMLMLVGTMASFADTEVSGELTESTTWTKDNSPYVLVGDVTVPEGATLTIEPGVTVILEKGSGLYNLDVYGCIIAEGTSMAQRDIQITGGRFCVYGEAKLRHCILDDRYAGVYMGEGAYAYVRGCLIKDNTLGFKCRGARVVVLENLIVHNEAGFWIINMVECNISSNTIAHNAATRSSFGLQIAGDGIVSLSHNNIYDNQLTIQWNHYSDPPDTIWATYNWWPDLYIAIAGNGVIIYEPRLDAPCEEAPAEETVTVRNESWGRIKSQFVQPNY